MAKSKIVLQKGRVCNWGGKILPAGVLPHFDIVGPLTPAIAELFGVKSSVFTQKGEVKPGFKKVELDFEGQDARLRIRPSGTIKVNGLGLDAECRKLHKVVVMRSGGGKGKPAVARVRFRLELPAAGDEMTLTAPIVFLFKAGSGEFEIEVDFVVLEQSAFSFEKKAPVKKAPVKKAPVKASAPERVM